jgi:flagellar motor switch protein FliM
MSDVGDRAVVVVPYDLATECNPAHSRMPALGPTLERLNDRFARLFRSVLLQHLRRGVTVTPARIELIKHKELLERFGGSNLLTLINMKPLHGTLLMVIDAPLASTIVEARFGGSNRFAISLGKREFTLLEVKLMQRVLEMVLEQFAIAWEPFALFEPSIIRHETNRQFASFAAADDLVFINAFDVTVDRSGGRLLTCIPDSSLEPLHNQLMSNIAEDGFNYDTRWYETLKQSVEQADITLSAQLGSIELSVSDLVALRPGDVFEMERPDSVIVESSGVPLFRGRWGRHGTKIAVRIEDPVGEPSEGS